jgi:hypothetical protein
MNESLVAEFESADALVAGAVRLCAMGYSHIEAYSPFPIAELESPIGVRRTRLPWVVLAGGLTGAAGAYAILWWTNAFDYPINVGGRPLQSLPAWIPIIFESMVLAAGSVAFLTALVFSGLPRLHHPIFELEGFERTTLDRFWLVVQTTFDERELKLLRDELVPLGAIAVGHRQRRST